MSGGAKLAVTVVPDAASGHGHLSLVVCLSLAGGESDDDDDPTCSAAVGRACSRVVFFVHNDGSAVSAVGRGQILERVSVPNQ